ncbi:MULTISPECIES: cell division protein ZapB [Treponema]|uniref:cell division protein ZapB n=1 Tax=Treponema TaxID=157 RepID=UPI0019604288|nr:cell division protein ZapB [Treponema sp. Marseille-Q4523]MBM7023392.1 cell division protein ZapB [Treponema sp. Marseille-Q4523]
MISLDQILLLERKVESAVEKISQLQSENDALRTKCAELTNALADKSERLSSIEQDQSKIEDGILKALDRLNSIENSVLRAGSAASAAKTPQSPKAPQSAPVRAAEPKKAEDDGQFDIF